VAEGDEGIGTRYLTLRAGAAPEALLRREWRLAYLASVLRAIPTLSAKAAA